MVPNAPLAFDPGKETHQPTFSRLVMHGYQVKRERDTYSLQIHDIFEI